jgi:DNA-binding response OmpR family regulator
MDQAKILLIEDNSQDSSFVSGLLEENGYSVYCAYNGRDALSKAKKEKFDLVILDLLLPDMKGEDICSQLKGRAYKKVPVMILSIKDEIEDIQQLFERGADDYIIKPPRPAYLLSRVEALVTKQA